MVKINGSSFALQYKRTTGRPIDSTETFKTLEDATSYARNTDAEEYFPYAGQIISVEIGEGVYKLVKDDAISEEDGRKHYRLSPIITEEESGNKYLSKLEDDEARGLITFLAGINVKIKAVIQKLIAEGATFSKGISSKDYVQNLLGWLITPEGHIDAKSLRLRDFLEVPELRYNRVSIVSGEEWNAPGGGIIESVDAANKTVHLKLEPGEVSQVEIDDICKGVFNNDTGFQTAYFRITEKIDNASFKYVLRSGYTFNPCKAMHFVAYGNFTNAERQKSCYSTQNYIRFLKGVNNWEITKDMIAMQLGDLSNLKLFGIDMSGHSAYLNRVYMTGTIRQISSDGVTEAPVPVFKGKWKSGTYWYYDEVTHNGSTWICIESTTTQEPSDSSTDWLKSISKGDKGEQGEPGKDGATGIGVKSISGQYYLSTSYSTTTGGSWSTTVPAWQDGKYIWTRSVITYTDNSYTETKPVCVTGGKGPSGNDGKGVKSFGILYYLSTSSSSLVGGSWSSTSPTWQNGKYLWSKTKVTYTDNSTWESDPVCITGSQGQTGLPGAMLRPRGVWAPNTEYYHNDAFIDTVIYNGQNKLCKITHTSTSSFDSTKWEEFSEFVNVATNVLLAQNATIDVLGTSGIFVGNLEKTEGWMITEGGIKHNQTGFELTPDGGINTANGQLILTANSTLIRTNTGKDIALFKEVDGVPMIDAKNINTENLVVTTGAKIGGFTVEGDNLITLSSGYIGVGVDSGTRFLRINEYGDSAPVNELLNIRNDTGAAVVLSGGGGMPTLSILANNNARAAIESAGAHFFKCRKGERWNAPGVLAAGTSNGSSFGYWSQGAPLSARKEGTGRWIITHNLGTNDYYVMITAREDSWDTWAGATIRWSNANEFAFRVRYGRTEADFAWDMVIIGNNSNLW